MYIMCPQNDERGILLLLGLPLIGIGLFCLAITNCMVNRENRAFVNYLELKVKTLQGDRLTDRNGRLSSTWPNTRGTFSPFPLIIPTKMSKKRLTHKNIYSSNLQSDS